MNIIIQKTGDRGKNKVFKSKSSSIFTPAVKQELRETVFSSPTPSTHSTNVSTPPTQNINDASAAFETEAGLRKHEEKGIHWFGKSFVTQYHRSSVLPPLTERGGKDVWRDLIIDKAHDRLISVTAPLAKKDTSSSSDTHDNNTSSMMIVDEEGNETMLVFEDLFVAGYANTKFTKRAKNRSSKQLDFIRAWIEFGEKFSKITPEQAAEIMKVAGTAFGQHRFPHIPFMQVPPHKSGKYRTFSYNELLDPFQLKSYAGKTSESIYKQLLTALDREHTAFIAKQDHNRGRRRN